MIPTVLGLLVLGVRWPLAPYELHLATCRASAEAVDRLVKQNGEIRSAAVAAERERDSALAEVSRLSSALDERRRHQEIADRLTEAHKFGIDELINKPPKQDRLPEWTQKGDEWLDGVFQSMHALGCTRQDIHHIESLGVVTVRAVVGDGTDPDANHQMSMLIMRLDWVANISTKYAKLAQRAS